jgi:hypothetical protein
MPNDRIILTSVIDQRKASTAPDVSVSRYFELFCASEILKDYDLSYEEIDSGTIGGGHDGGIDSVFLILNDELIQEDTDIETLSKKRRNEIEIYIIQSKKTNGFTEDTINKLIASVENIFDLSKDISSLSAFYNKELLDIVDRFRCIYNSIVTSFPTISINFYYSTLGNEVHPNVKKRVNRLEQAVKNLFDNANFNFSFLGARELLQLARREPSSTFELEYAENPISTETGSYICLVPILSYYNFFVDEHGVIIKRIFDANVRDYQGSVKVNKAIQDTLQNPGKEDFWFLNNGVTIVCPKASASGKKLIIEDPQIVNGLQTSYEIYNYFSSISEEREEKRKLLIRIIVEQDSLARDNIVRATNSQTSIPQTSLRAADKIQRDIEDYLYHQGYFYERRKNYYKNSGKQISKIVSISYLSQVVISILMQQPDYARARPSTLIDKDEDYIKIFNEKYPIQIYLTSIKLMKRVEERIRIKSDEFSLERKDINNIKFHLAMQISMLLTNKKANIDASDIEMININILSDEMIDLELNGVIKSYKNNGGDDQTAKGREFVKDLIDNFSPKI